MFSLWQKNSNSTKSLINRFFDQIIFDFFLHITLINGGTFIVEITFAFHHFLFRPFF
jgi:hypothetical protein